MHEKLGPLEKVRAIKELDIRRMFDQAQYSMIGSNDVSTKPIIKLASYHIKIKVKN